jgi:DNA-binding HxlR family transcriptional regulator
MPDDELLDVIRRKGTVDIIYSLGSDDPKRFSELETEFAGELSHTTVSERLKTLESLGVVRRESSGDRPPNTFYSLTNDGERLRGLLDDIRDLNE